MSRFDVVDVHAAGMACGLGAQLPEGAHLSQVQCQVVCAINERLTHAQALVELARDVLLSDRLEQREYVQQRLAEFMGDAV